ncbi:MAG: SDR family oxidoreductase [Planctomycetota bacterium]|nr:SDR family oxidoreductase [Planctomycetota bacterium]
MEKLALITGGNKGIGLETARQLGKLGIHVLIGSRDGDRGRVAVDKLRSQGVRADAVQLEVTSQASIDEAARHVSSSFGRLDILVNNAGVLLYGRDGLVSTTTLQTLRETFEANFFGMVAVTQAFLPLLRNSGAGRIVNLTSVLGSIAEHADPNSSIYQAKFLAYDSSKAAVNMFTNHLAHELRGTAIKVNAAHPGWVKTDMGTNEAPLEVEEGARTSVWLATLPPEGPTGGFYHTQVHMRW